MSFVGSVGTVFGQGPVNVKPSGFDNFLQANRTQSYVMGGNRKTDFLVDLFKQTADIPTSPVAKQFKK